MRSDFLSEDAAPRVGILNCGPAHGSQSRRPSRTISRSGVPGRRGSAALPGRRQDDSSQRAEDQGEHASLVGDHDVTAVRRWVAYVASLTRGCNDGSPGCRRGDRGRRSDPAFVATLEPARGGHDCSARSGTGDGPKLFCAFFARETAKRPGYGHPCSHSARPAALRETSACGCVGPPLSRRRAVRSGSIRGGCQHTRMR